jgi:hypothetical protein
MWIIDPVSPVAGRIRTRLHIDTSLDPRLAQVAPGEITPTMLRIVPSFVPVTTTEIIASNNLFFAVVGVEFQLYDISAKSRG